MTHPLDELFSVCSAADIEVHPDFSRQTQEERLAGINLRICSMIFARMQITSKVEEYAQDLPTRAKHALVRVCTLGVRNPRNETFKKIFNEACDQHGITERERVYVHKGISAAVAGFKV